MSKLLFTRSIMLRAATIIGSLSALLIGCDSQVETSSNAGGGNGSASAGSGGAAGSKECSAFKGLDCSSTEWCDYEPSTCGEPDQSGRVTLTCLGG